MVQANNDPADGAVESRRDHDSSISLELPLLNHVTGRATRRYLSSVFRVSLTLSPCIHLAPGHLQIRQAKHPRSSQSPLGDRGVTVTVVRAFGPCRSAGTDCRRPRGVERYVAPFRNPIGGAAMWAVSWLRSNHAASAAVAVGLIAGVMSTGCRPRPAPWFERVYVTIRLRVIDGDSSAPIEGASLVVIDRFGRRAQPLRSDGTGFVSLTRPFEARGFLRWPICENRADHLRRLVLRGLRQRISSSFCSSGGRGWRQHAFGALPPKTQRSDSSERDAQRLESTARAVHTLVRRQHYAVFLWRKVLRGIE